MPRISVILAVHNGAQYLEQAVKSVLGQSLQSLELVIVDDGSTDATASLVGRFTDDDPRVRAFHIPASGRPSVPRNFGLDRAKGDYIAFLDHDDWYHPLRLARMVEALDAHPAWVAAFHDIRLVEADGRERLGTFFHNHHFLAEAAPCFRHIGEGWFETGRQYYDFMCRRNTGIQIQSVVVARHRIDFGSFRFARDMVTFEDNDLWFQLALLGTIGYLDRTLAYYRQRPDSLTADLDQMRHGHLQMHLRNLVRAENVLGREELLLYRHRIAALHFDAGVKLLETGEISAARKELRAALKMAPAGRHRMALAKTWVPHWLYTALRGPTRAGAER